MKADSSIKTFKLPKGFLANGIHCGSKKKRKDLAIFYSEDICQVAALFTNNVVKAAPVVLAIEQLRKTKGVRAIFVNSGNANCMTGKQGMTDAEAMVKSMAKLLGVSPDEVLVSSTGIIGQLLDLKPINSGMPKLVKGLSREGISDATDGIMTTDSFRKISMREFKISGKKVRITGVAKGAGMVKPNMATMLSYIMTDAYISKKALEKALKGSIDTSFNAITVDGDMSTNDTVMVMANGKAGNVLIKDSGKDFKIFCDNVNAVAEELAKMIVRDGEGASKVIEVRIIGAKTKSDAKKVAESVADSLLVKCAVLGGDPNWGRIASSAGASGVKFNPDKMEVVLDGIRFFNKGKACSVNARKKALVFKGDDAHILVNLKAGKAEAVFYSCDISKKYITFNAHYTT